MTRRQTILGDEDRDEIVARYTVRFEKFGVDIRTLNAGKGNKLAIQHEIHASIGDLEGKRVLDIGCGLASFYEHLHAKGISVNYIGYDIVPSFVEINRIRFPEATFELHEISRDAIVHEADYAIMCQVFNGLYKTVGNEDIVRDAIDKAFAAVTTGVSIDLRTDYGNYRDPEQHHFSPEELFDFAKSLTPFVALRHDYLPCDFTLALYKEGTMRWE
jgi:SAM-dependent methyltransferase